MSVTTFVGGSLAGRRHTGIMGKSECRQKTPVKAEVCSSSTSEAEVGDSVSVTPLSPFPKRGRGHPRISRCDDQSKEPVLLQNRKRSFSSSSTTGKSPLTVNSTTEQEVVARSVRKRKKPAAFDDYVSLDAITRSKAKAAEQKSQCERNAPDDAAAVAQASAVEQELGVVTRPQNEVEAQDRNLSPAPVSLQCDRESRPTPRRPPTCARTREWDSKRKGHSHKPDIPTLPNDVTRDVAKDKDSPVKPAPANVTLSHSHSFQFGRAPPDAAPFLVAGPPRGSPVKCPASFLRTALPMREKEKVKSIRLAAPVTATSQLVSTGRPPIKLATSSAEFPNCPDGRSPNIQTVQEARLLQIKERKPMTLQLQRKSDIDTDAFDEYQPPIVCITDKGKMTLEPVSVSLSYGARPRELYAFMDENSKCLGYGIIDDDGNLVKQLDYEEIDHESVEDVVEEGENILDIDVSAEPVRLVEAPKVSPARSEAEHELPSKEFSEEQETLPAEPPGPMEDDEAPPLLALEVEIPTVPCETNVESQKYSNDVVAQHFMDQNGVEYTEGAEHDASLGNHEDALNLNFRTVEFNFMDQKNICCGLCGDIVPYDQLVNVHLAQNHAELLGDCDADLEEIPYETWLREKLKYEKRTLESGFRSETARPSVASLFPQYPLMGPRRLVSQIRVCPAEMTLPELERCLRLKLVEKLGRQVNVSLVDKQHAQCGVCGTIVSLNKKFEAMNVVRHFNAWHSKSHRCSGTWLTRIPQPGMGKPLSMQDFAVVDVPPSCQAENNNLQCVWCGMLINRNTLAMHYYEVHNEDIEVPRCRLCIEELVINAQLLEQFAENFEVTMPDETHFRCAKIEQTFSSEARLTKAIEKSLTLMGNAQAGGTNTSDTQSRDTPGAVRNSQMHYGRRNKPKRSFVMPAYRQALPVDSQYVFPISDTQWQCKKCPFVIMAAVMSSGCINHYKLYHPEDLDGVRFELCKSRLERISDGCMEIIHASVIECLVCSVSLPLHKPYNICRAVNHLKKKHSEMMPENTGTVRAGYSKDIVQAESFEGTCFALEVGSPQKSKHYADDVRELEETSELMAEAELVGIRKPLKTDLDYDQARLVQTADGRSVYLLVKDGMIADSTYSHAETTVEVGCEVVKKEVPFSENI